MECSESDLPCSLVNKNDQMAVDPELTIEHLAKRLGEFAESLRTENMQLSARLEELSADNKQFATRLEAAHEEIARLAAVVKDVRAEQSMNRNYIREIVNFTKRVSAVDENKMIE